MYNAMYPPNAGETPLTENDLGGNVDGDIDRFAIALMGEDLTVRADLYDFGLAEFRAIACRDVLAEPAAAC
ncbi:hypothetical protein SAMN05421812_115176 [Asanoa hainanensis]|uniref:Uncharacterized protein n=1 Tax=Asanoa hainanensis TaxID=560556 RepID=A0A239P9N1_9ACTN|nr:hypothetical protein SAMN05421812_115176 [Asanoa hainanensis]